MTRAIDQTLALFHDAYRELNSRRLFWFSLVISALVVVSFAGVGMHGDKLSFFGLTTPIPAFSTLDVVYKLMFSNLGVGLWLTFLGMILALFSTAGIFPDLITGGTIDLYLSKPISRLRLFLTKYVTGLMFAALQVTVFCLAAWLVLGVRAGVWSPKLFVAIPLVVCVFSYLFCVQVLLGLLTRSTVAAILITALFWGTLFTLDKGEVIVLTVKVMSDQSLHKWDRRHPPGARATTAPSAAAEREDLVRSAHRWDFIHRLVYDTKTSLPKTRETNDVLDRLLLSREELRQLNDQRADEQRSSMAQAGDEGNGRGRNNVGLDPAAQRELAAALNARTAWWSVGTSLIFEAIVVAAGAWVFCRRDY